MKEIVIIFVTALISGLLATVVTLWWQQRMEKKNNKRRIFETLMAYRYMIHDKESVHALNSVDVIFYKDQNVRKAYADFLDEADKQPEMNPQLYDKHLKLLEEMASVLGLKDIRWNNIKRVYYPTGLAQDIEDEKVLRTLQIQNAMEMAQRNDMNQDVEGDI